MKNSGVFAGIVIPAVVLLLNSAVLAGNTITVCWDGSGDYTTIQEGIDAAVGGDTVLVANGTYTGTGNKNLDFGGLAITVQSVNGPNSCIIDCENDGRGFKFQNGEGSGSTVSGFTIKNGYDLGSGGAIYCTGASPTIENCIITNNRAYGADGFWEVGDDWIIVQQAENGYGGGVYCTANSNPLIVNCRVIANTAKGGKGLQWTNQGGNGGHGYGGGVYAGSGSNPMVENTVFAQNTALGGVGGTQMAIAFDGGDAYGGAMYSDAQSTISVKNCLANNNQAVGGNGGSGSEVGGNGGDAYGGGLYCYWAAIGNCTVFENIAAGGERGESYSDGIAGNAYGAGVYANTGGTTNISNSIVWGNDVNEIEGVADVSYSDVEGGYSGTNNIDSDPYFVSGPLGDYYLSQIAAGQAINSLCVDSGSDTAANLGMDIFTTRTDCIRDKGTVDMGYHYPPDEGVRSADIERNWYVDFLDFAVLAGEWLQWGDPESLAGDILIDGQVNIHDLDVLTAAWLDCYVTAAYNANPGHTVAGVDPNTALSWSVGEGALYHDVYLGTDGNAVAAADYLSPEFKGTVSEPNFDPCGLEEGTLYYWRIDEVGPACIKKGNVWNFRTLNLALEPGLVGWWEFDEGQGDIGYDSAGSNDGTIYGAQWTAGKIGDYALDFDGDGDYVEIPDDDSLTPASQLTIAFWIYNRGGQSAGIYKYASCPSELQGPESPSNSRAYYCAISDSTGLVYLRVFSSTYIYDSIVSVNSVPLNVWHHIAATFEAGEAAIYIDGQLDNMATMSVSSIMNDVHPVIIGGHWDYCSGANFVSRLNGIIDDVRLYDRALTGLEVAQLYQAGLN